MTAAPASRTRDEDGTTIVLGGYAALAESAWMGAAQANEVLEPLHIGGTTQLDAPRHRRRLAQLLTRPCTVAEGTVVLMAAFVCSALLGALRQILFNAQFGVGMEANAYYAAFRLPDTLFSLIAGGALSSAMIPVLLATTRAEGAAAGMRLTRLVLTTLLAVFAVLTLLGELFAPVVVRQLLAPGFDEPTSRLTILLTRIMLLQPLILAVGSVATAVLNSRNQFIVTALAVASHNIALIAGILAARAFPQLGIYGPTLGVVGGAMLQLALLLPGLRLSGVRLHLAWAPRDQRLREIVRLLIPNGLSVGVGYAGFILDTAFASRAPELAALPALQNAWLLVGLPIALLGQAVGQSAFPRLAAHAASGAWLQLRRSLGQALGAVMVLALPALVALILLGRPTIAMLFEHGRFDAAAGTLTYRVLTIYALALPAYVATEVITRGLIALQDTRTPLLTNSLQFAGRALIMLLLLDRVGVLAIPIAFATSAALETLALATALLVKLHQRLRVARLAVT